MMYSLTIVHLVEPNPLQRTRCTCRPPVRRALPRR
jgi:hypothetical protein